MPVKRNRFFSRFGPYLLAAYAVLGAALFVGIVGDQLSQIVGLVAVASYVAGLVVLSRVAGYAPPFGWKAPNPNEESAVLRDLSWFGACILGCFVVVLVGVLVNPTSTVGVLLVAIPSVSLVVVGGMLIARVLGRFVKGRPRR